MKDNILVIHPRDNVAVALRTLAAGEQATGKGSRDSRLWKRYRPAIRSPCGTSARVRRSSNTERP